MYRPQCRVYENSAPPEWVVQPDDDVALPRENTWMFAALNSVEPPILAERVHVRLAMPTG